MKINNSFQVIETLTTISSSSKYNHESTSTARCLAHGLSDFELIVSLCVSRHVLSHFKSVTVSLQGVGIDVITGFRMIKTVKETLQNVSLLDACDVQPKPACYLEPSMVYLTGIIPII